MFISHLQVLQNIMTNSNFQNNTIFTTVKMVAPQGTVKMVAPWSMMDRDPTQWQNWGP